jgi:hypothetical protein
LKRKRIHFSYKKTAKFKSKKVQFCFIISYLIPIPIAVETSRGWGGPRFITKKGVSAIVINNGNSPFIVLYRNEKITFCCLLSFSFVARIAFFRGAP